MNSKIEITDYESFDSDSLIHHDIYIRYDDYPYVVIIHGTPEACDANLVAGCERTIPSPFVAQGLFHIFGIPRPENIAQAEAKAIELATLFLDMAYGKRKFRLVDDE